MWPMGLLFWCEISIKLYSTLVTVVDVSVEDIMKHSSSRSSVDLLGAPVPSAIPSPDLHPVAKQLDLMNFENVAGIIFCT